jgi:protein MAK16
MASAPSRASSFGTRCSHASDDPSQLTRRCHRRIAKEQTFCRNVYNVTGLCNRTSCPLANGRYATIGEHEGRIYLYMKTIERAHTPAKLWERVKLSQNYAKALEQVSGQLEHWPKALQHRNKQRLTKIYQYLVRSRRLQLKKTTKLVSMNTNQEKLEGRREEKALVAAKLEHSIKAELLDRLKRGTYGDFHNVPEGPPPLPPLPRLFPLPATQVVLQGSNRARLARPPG